MVFTVVIHVPPQPQTHIRLNSIIWKDGHLPPWPAQPDASIIFQQSKPSWCLPNFILDRPEIIRQDNVYYAGYPSTTLACSARGKHHLATAEAPWCLSWLSMWPKLQARKILHRSQPSRCWSLLSMYRPSCRQRSSRIILQHSKPSWCSNPARQHQSADLRRNPHLRTSKIKSSIKNTSSRNNKSNSNQTTIFQLARMRTARRNNSKNRPRQKDKKKSIAAAEEHTPRKNQRPKS